MPFSLLRIPVSLRRALSALMLSGVVLLGLPAPAATAQSIAAHTPDAAADRPSVYADGPSEDVWEPLFDLRQQRKFREALSRVNDVKQQYPNHADVLWRAALLWVDLGQTAENSRKAVAFYQQALQNADAALAADSTHAWAHLVKALAEGRLSLHEGTRTRIERSRTVKRHAERALALDSTLATAYHVRGRWYRNVADLNFLERAIVKTVYGGLPSATFEESARDLERAASMESRSYHHLELAKTYLAMGREADAKAQLRAALTADPSPLDPKYQPEARDLLRELE